MIPPMFQATLALHSLLRWAVLAFGALALVRALAGWLGDRPWTSLDDRAGKYFVAALDLQLLVGLVLYAGLSPIPGAAFSDMGAAMKDTLLRFYAVEHVVLMLAGVALVHVGRVRTRKAATDQARHRTAAIFFLLGLLAILAGIPWPGRVVGRPLLPTF
jgi:putative Ca2+/H+ antiporter (TMEM165/GDT1 family)